ncbi:hypothetical protein BGZ79_004949 [Entomortierella chlamydospora]|nr:hypothetical protein BGZ79_004949 [Entomortierella chlamydospora]
MMTHQGVRQLTLEEYLKVVRVYEPDIVAAFADSISDLDHTELGKLIGPEPGAKRVKKSVDRSLKWLDQILKERQGFDTIAEERAKEEEAKMNRKKNKQHQGTKDNGAVEQIEKETKALDLDSTKAVQAKPTLKPWTGVSVFAHVVGAQNEQERIRSAQETAKRQEVDGFIIDTNTLLGSKDEVLRLLKVSIDHLPKEKPRLVYGMQAPEDVLKSIALGADLFDTTYPYQLTEDGKASLYNFGANSTVSSLINKESNSSSKRWINLWDDEHQDKFVPLLEGCECYACKGGRHTRAYINHLLRAHEMLATVLLMSHNMYQYSKFFANVRQSIQDGTFEQYSTSFIETFGTEPERTGEVHPAQLILEAALSKRNRLDGEGDEDTEAINAAAIAAELKKKEKEQMRQARREKLKEEGLRIQAEKRRLQSEQRQEKEVVSQMP